MLRQRILTALVLIPPLVWGILVLPSTSIAALLGAIVVLAAWEWAGLVGIERPLSRLVFVLLQAGFVAMGWYRLSSVAWSNTVLLAATLWWIGVMIWVSRHAMTTVPPASAWPFGTRVVAGLLTLTPAWWALTWLHTSERYGAIMVVFLLSLVWVADSAAYFTGRRWGSRCLAPAISPAKTQEGVVGAIVAAVVFSCLSGAVWGLHGLSLGGFVGLSLLAVAFSILGDLFESVLKRQARVKDSGRLLPGHGGVLDRIDSITAAAPVFVAGLSLSGIAP